MEEHEQAIHNLKSDLEISQKEAKNLLEQNAELQHALIIARDQLKQQHLAMQGAPVALSVASLGIEDGSPEVSSGAESSNYGENEKEKPEVISEKPEIMSEAELINEEDDERKSSNSSSYSIVDYEADRSSGSEPARADSLTGDTLNQTNVVNISSLNTRLHQTRLSDFILW